MPSTAFGALVGAGCCLTLAPYLAVLTYSAPDRDDAHWWRWRARRPVPAARMRAVAVLALSVGALAGAGAGLSAVLPAFVALAAICTPLIVIDLAEHRLPNRLVASAAVAAVVLLPVAALVRHDGGALLRSAEAGVAVFAVLFALCLIAPRSFGFGDVKLGGVLGAYLGWFGWREVYYGIFAGFLLGSVVALGLLATRRASLKTAMAFGPMLILGALVVPAFGLVPGG
ncbi:MAG TPA: A24 family peptidase [Jatrophihabitantaceae bacterium]|jgi:leader peptidase (prepilin peptidase)/N-methyltransferase|nr:A24 family peptidase [Jatrophihabitantaceae bacterium]